MWIVQSDVAKVIQWRNNFKSDADIPNLKKKKKKAIFSNSPCDIGEYKQ